MFVSSYMFERSLTVAILIAFNDVFHSAVTILFFTEQLISIDFLGKIADSIQFRSQFSYRRKTALTMPEFTNTQALQGHSRLLMWLYSGQKTPATRSR